MSLRTLVKRALPPTIAKLICQSLMIRRERELGRLPLQQAFDEVYKRGFWKQGVATSGKGSEGALADKYVDLVTRYASRHGLRTVVDGGCGDFSVGHKLVSAFESYIALDISPIIIARNQKQFAHLGRQVSFRVANMTEGSFPDTDLVLIREVLQHLTNAQIEKILDNLRNSVWRRALITEYVHDPNGNQTPNLDLPSHSIRTRTFMHSGVFIDKPPFDCKATRLATLHASDLGEADRAGLLVMELSRDG